MGYPCYTLDLTQSFEEKALLCTNLCAQRSRDPIRTRHAWPASSSAVDNSSALNPRHIPPQKWVPSNRWFHRSHLNAAIVGGAGVGGIASMQFRERKRKELRARNPWGVLLARLLLGFDMHLAS